MFSSCLKTTSNVNSSDKVNENSNHSGSSEEVFDLKGDQFTDRKDVVINLDLKVYDLWALALTTSIAGHYLTWNEGLSAGFGSFLVATVWTASGFVCLFLCLAELSSALPFAGGAYGIARVTLGIYPGFLVACADSYKSIMSVAFAAISFGQLITIITGEKEAYEPLYWLFFYAICLSIQLYGGRSHWRATLAVAVVSITLLIIYLLGSAKSADLPKYAPLDDDSLEDEMERWFRYGAYGFMHILPRPCWFFIGIQCINLASGEMVSPKTEVPKAYIASMCTTLLTSFSVLLTACALYPGTSALRHRTFSLTRGYMIMFDLPRHLATIISIPAIFASGLGFMYFFGQQLRAMGQSGLLNPVFAWELPGRRTPAGALLIGSVVGYALCLLSFFAPGVRTKLYNISMMGALATYLSIFVSFWQFRTHFPTIKREFVSPLGRAGAVWGFLVFSLTVVSIAGFQKSQTPIITFVAIMVVASVYYYLVVQKREVFSEEEKVVMFKAYLIKGNAAKAKRIKRGPAVLPANQRGSSPRDGAAGIEINTLAPTEGDRRKSTRSTAATPMSAVSHDTVTQVWEGGAMTLQSAGSLAAPLARNLDIPSGRRQACLVTSPNTAEESPAGETMELLPPTSTTIVATEREGEYDEENPPLSAAVLTNPASNDEENRLI